MFLVSPHPRSRDYAYTTLQVTESAVEVTLYAPIAPSWRFLPAICGAGLGGAAIMGIPAFALAKWMHAAPHLSRFLFIGGVCGFLLAAGGLAGMLFAWQNEVRRHGPVAVWNRQRRTLSFGAQSAAITDTRESRFEFTSSVETLGGRSPAELVRRSQVLIRVGDEAQSVATVLGSGKALRRFHAIVMQDIR